MGRRPVLVFLSLLLSAAAACAQTHSLAGANAYVARQDRNGLIAYARAWASEAPQDPMPWYYLGNTYGIELNRPQMALAAFQRAAQLRPQWPEVWNALGHVNAQLGRYSDSAAAFARAAQQRPSEVQYWINVASADSDSNQWELARQALLAGEKNAANAAWSDWYNLGNGFLALRQYGQAASAFQRSLHLNPRYAFTWTNLGAALESGGNPSGALNAYRQAANLGDPLGKKDFTGLERAIRQVQSQPSGSQGSNIQRMLAAQRQGHIFSYMVQHPEASYGQAAGAAPR